MSRRLTDSRAPQTVMAGLVPAIHVAPPDSAAMDARNESGHDDGIGTGRDDRSAAVPRRMSGAGR